MLNPISISYEENRLVNIGEHEYKEFYQLAEKMVGYLLNFYEKPKLEANLYFRFLSQVQKSLYLSLLSTLRQHDIQTNIMLRYSLESISLCLYSMYERNEDVYREFSDDGTVQSFKITKKVGTWLESESSQFAQSIHFMKNTINAFSSHGNILPTAFNSNLDDGKFTFHFFDIVQPNITKQRLWWISDICFGFLDMSSKLNLKYPCFTLNEVEFLNIMHQSHAILTNQKEILKKILQSNENT
ncbi:hypothetical protein BK125_17275 [Paenibacillus odorifer]|uniref:Uncharacterized protein n=1 Tax=Paenibacillus odorifer TaxID=189426 RepID=A0ABX3GM88_9BACL|nr:hypothetical protein [Paenibacillus odorifer]OMC76805.1 hypothetical protein BK125_17275 [Paenibacillus odorifer]OMD33132.1 hypothetical protein BSO21_15635 [Paenibacillus odorifer]